jgi:hypothetical protein
LDVLSISKAQTSDTYKKIINIINLIEGIDIIEEVELIEKVGIFLHQQRRSEEPQEGK